MNEHIESAASIAVAQRTWKPDCGVQKRLF